MSPWVFVVLAGAWFALFVYFALHDSLGFASASIVAEMVCLWRATQRY